MSLAASMPKVAHKSLFACDHRTFSWVDNAIFFILCGGLAPSPTDVVEPPRDPGYARPWPNMSLEHRRQSSPDCKAAARAAARASCLPAF
jgi:hypothetical protein